MINMILFYIQCSLRTCSIGELWGDSKPAGVWSHGPIAPEEDLDTGHLCDHSRCSASCIFPYTLPHGNYFLCHMAGCTCLHFYSHNRNISTFLLLALHKTVKGLMGSFENQKSFLMVEDISSIMNFLPFTV